MSDMSEHLWLHAYSGRENGLMVVGTPEALRSLGQQLVGLNELSRETLDPWPQQVVAPVTSGPYRDVTDLQLSFHVAGSAPPEQILPLRRQSLPALVLLVIASCAAVGIVTIARWVLQHAL